MYNFFFIVLINIFLVIIFLKFNFLFSQRRKQSKHAFPVKFITRDVYNHFIFSRIYFFSFDNHRVIAKKKDRCKRRMRNKKFQIFNKIHTCILIGSKYLKKIDFIVLCLHFDYNELNTFDLQVLKK